MTLRRDRKRFEAVFESLLKSAFLPRKRKTKFTERLHARWQGRSLAVFEGDVRREGFAARQFS